MVQVSVDEEVDVVCVRDRLVTAAVSVGVARVVRAARVCWGARGGVGSGDGDHVLVDMAVVWMVKMPLVQVVDVPVVLDRGVAASRSVLVIVSAVRGVIAHGSLSLFLRGAKRSLACAIAFAMSSVT